MNRTIDIRDLALNLGAIIGGLNDYTTKGPLTVTRDGEPEAVIIRSQSYDPKLKDYTFEENGDVVCRRCPTLFVIVTDPVSLAEALEAANQHWRNVHFPKVREALLKAKQEGRA